MKILRPIVLFVTLGFVLCITASCQEEAIEPSAESKQRDAASGLATN
ncbi:MAG: hypothetical protein AAGA64_14585 [Bacteroidota bacterium]